MTVSDEALEPNWILPIALKQLDTMFLEEGIL